MDRDRYQDVAFNAGFYKGMEKAAYLVAETGLINISKKTADAILYAAEVYKKDALRHAELNAKLLAISQQPCLDA